MKEFFKNAWKILLAILAVVGVVLGMKRKQDDKEKEEFESNKNVIEKDITKIEGKEEIVTSTKENQKKELADLKEEAKAIERGVSADLDKTKVKDINYLKDFVKKHGKQ